VAPSIRHRCGAATECIYSRPYRLLDDGGAGEFLAKSMDDLAREKLCELVSTYGPGLCDDVRRCEGLLRDACGEHKREVFALVTALRERVPADLLAKQSESPWEVLLARLAGRLQSNVALIDHAARWAVESWALALGVAAVGRGRWPSSEGSWASPSSFLRGVRPCSPVR
jgi:hypothetical protein